MTHEATEANRRLTNDEVRIMKERVFDLEARWLLMIQQADLIKPVTALEALLQETNELIAIFVASLKTTAKGRD